MHRLVRYLASLLPAAMLLLTVSGHRRGSFFLLRLVVSVGAAFLVLVANKQNAVTWMWVMIGILVLFNPLVPMHLRWDVWRLVDLAAAGVFVAAAFALRSSPGARKATAPR